MKITWNSKALVITLLYRMLFGGYLAGVDQYHFNDFDSAVTVIAIYALLGTFLTLFILGKRVGLVGIIGLEAIFIILNSVFIIAALGQITDAGLHNPLDNWWATLLRYTFSILTIVFAIRTYKEK